MRCEGMDTHQMWQQVGWQYRWVQIGRTFDRSRENGQVGKIGLEVSVQIVTIWYRRTPRLGRDKFTG